ncbi:predicted protein [Streptomyces sp. AA4]|nr:predicted protein [Streptomyces sp. AA4]
MLGFATTSALLISGVFLIYVVVLAVTYLRREHYPDGDSRNFDWHFLVPCRDEEAVIGATIAYLRDTFPRAHVWVIDDASEDATGAIVSAHAAADKQVHQVRRQLPDARTGKGDALNAAYRVLSDWIHPSRPRDRCVVVVVDADGRLSRNALEACASDRLFGDDSVGAVQIEVRMINRDVRQPYPDSGRVRNFFGRTLVRLQDLEFRTAISAMQVSRRKVGTVGMGGNGQFTRLSVLDRLAEGSGPWRGSLLEDFELGVHVLLAGFRTEYCDDAWVDQEALPQLDRFLAQRTRWAQGTMQCIRYLPTLWRSGRVSNVGVLELSYFLAQPWLQLFGTITYPLPVIAFVNNLVLYPAQTMIYLGNGGAVLFAIYVLVGIAQFALWGPIYRRQSGGAYSWWRCIGWGIAFSFMMYLFYLTAWRALGRVVRGHNGWAKTRRNREVNVLGPVSKDS